MTEPTYDEIVDVLSDVSLLGTIDDRFGVFNEVLTKLKRKLGHFSSTLFDGKLIVGDITFDIVDATRKYVIVRIADLDTAKMHTFMLHWKE